MKRLLHLLLIMLLLAPIEISLISTASANEYPGSTCKKLNAKDWYGTDQIVCKKNKKGKLVWTYKNVQSTQLDDPWSRTYRSELSEKVAKTTWCITHGYRDYNYSKDICTKTLSR